MLSTVRMRLQEITQNSLHVAMYMYFYVEYLHETIPFLKKKKKIITINSSFLL